MKYKLTVIVIFIMLLMTGVVSAEEATFAELYVGQVTAKVDGETITIDTAPTIYNDRMLIPIRAVSEMFGFTVVWDKDTQAISISNEDTEINMNIGSQTIQKVSKDGTYVIEADTLPIIIDSYTMVPVRFIADAFDFSTYWDEAQGRTVISSLGWGAKKIGIDTLINYLEETGKISNGIKVAVIDTGMDCNHIYLRNRIVNPYNAANKSNHVSDLNGHGTHVAGIIANCTPETVKIMPVRVYDDNGLCTENAVAEGIRYAMKNGAKVINISMQKSLDKGGKTIENAVNEAVRNNCTVVVAAGNEGDDVSKYTPACIENAIVTTAVDRNDALGVSNYGKTITVSAPGIGIASSYSDGSFAINSGTSMASAYASAAAALIMMDISEVTPTEVKNMFIRYSRDMGVSGYDDLYGSGIIDLRQYVQNRRNNIVNDFSVSVEEKAKNLDAEIEEIRQAAYQLGGIFGMLIDNNFAIELNRRGVRKYNSEDYFAAGYLFEKSIEEGDCDKSLSKNNLAFLLRRGFYVSGKYDLDWLLSRAKSEKNTLSFLNDALLQASKNNWEVADLLIKECADTCQIADDDIDFWETLSNNHDLEGDLVLGWLMRYNLYSGYNASQKDYIDKAKTAYPNIPSWLYEKAV